MKYTFRVRKDEYAWEKWYAEMLEWGVVVRRYDFPSEAEAQAAIREWQNHLKSCHTFGYKASGIKHPIMVKYEQLEGQEQPTGGKE